MLYSLHCRQKQRHRGLDFRLQKLELCFEIEPAEPGRPMFLVEIAAKHILLKYLQQSLSTTSNTDGQLLCQKTHQKLSVIIINTGISVVFKKKT